MSVTPMSRACWLALFVAALFGGTAQASTQLDRTRLIVTQTEARAVLQVHSDQADPVLLQIWIDDGQKPAATKASLPSTVPFIADPPVMRLDPGQSRAISALLTGSPEALPADRESLYWLNVLQIPVTPPSDQRLQITVQSRLKLFYRPAALARYQAATLPDAERLRFALERDDASGQAWLRVHNPAPIHQTLAALTLTSDTTSLTLDAPMLAPFETLRLVLPSTLPEKNTHAAIHLRFATLDDNGNAITDEQTL